ncbi:MAG: hypothetical protein V7604_2700 [Hyphomicrobiales bacterium]
MAELIVRFVFEILFSGIVAFFAWIGRVIAHATIPLLTAGRVRVAPVPGNLNIVERWHGIHRLTDGSPVMGERLAAIAGLVILTIVLLTALFVVASMRA